MHRTAITLICNRAAPLLDDDFSDRFSGFLSQQGAGSIERVVLADGVAKDFLCSGGLADTALKSAIAQFIGQRPIDVVVQPVERRRKKLLIADMDSTIIEQECIDELAEYAGKRAEISAITERAMRGELDFEGALKARVAMLKGLPESVLAETFEKHITLTPGAAALVKTMNAQGAMTALVSGGFTYFTGRVAAKVGFQYNQANILLVENGVLSGAVAMPILGRAAKEDALVRLAADNKIDLADTLAAGDGANDLSMLGRSGLGVAFHAKPAVAQAAHARINHGDLTALLYLQGVAKADFEA